MKANRVALIIANIGVILIILGKRANKIRCYNLPINDFYNDIECKEYWNKEE